MNSRRMLSGRAAELLAKLPPNYQALKKPFKNTKLCRLGITSQIYHCF